MSFLTPVEREAINDSMLKIQSVQASLNQVDDDKIPEMAEIHACLRTAHTNLQSALRGRPAGPPPRL
jgi:hypothetical protein